jgi:hypothetical protein
VSSADPALYISADGLIMIHVDDIMIVAPTDSVEDGDQAEVQCHGQRWANYGYVSLTVLTVWKNYSKIASRNLFIPLLGVLTYCYCYTCLAAARHLSSRRKAEIFV